MEVEVKSKLECLHGQPLTVIYKGINDIVKSLQHSESVCDVISLLDYKDCFERFLKLNLIKQYKQSEYVVELLISEDPRLIKQALKFSWFFKGTNETIVDANYFASNVFPYTSVLTREQIIKQLSAHLKSEKRAEDFFNLIKKEYGISQAVNLLPACGISFISAFLNSSDIKLTSAHLIKLFHKSKDFVHSFLCNLCDQKHKNIREWNVSMKTYKGLFLFLARNHTSYFIELCGIVGKPIPGINLGRRSSKKLVCANKLCVIDSANIFVHMLNHKYLYRCFTVEEFQAFYYNLFPDSFDSIHSAWNITIPGSFSLIEHLSDASKFNLILNVFQKKYGKNLLDHDDLLSQNLLKILPLSEKHKVAEKRLAQKQESYVPLNYWLCYLPVEQSIPKIKELLNEAGDGRAHSELAPYLIETCRVNCCYFSLAEVLNYFSARFRNDDITVRNLFVAKVLKEFNVLKLTDEHWRPLSELLKISIFNKELLRHSAFTKLFEKYICYCILNSSPSLDSVIKQFIQLQLNLLQKSQSCNFLISDRKFQRQCLILIGTFLPSVQSFESLSDPAVRKVILSYLTALHSWNAAHKKDQVSAVTFPWLASCLSLILQSDNGDIEKFVNLIFNDTTTRQDLYSLMLAHCPEPKVLIKFIQHTECFEEDLCIRIINYIFEKSCIEQYRAVFKKIMIFASEKFKLYTLLKQKCINIESKNQEETRCRSLFVLSYIDPEKFLLVLKSVIPSTPKVDVLQEQNKDVYEIQKMVTRCVSNIQPLPDLNILLPFCQGDYLKLILGSLISICLNTPEYRVVPFLQVLSGKAVSVRKHSIRLFCRILSPGKTIQILADRLENETHPSIRKVLLEIILNLFSVEPEIEMFQLLKKAVSSLTVKDKVSFDLLTSVNNINKSYKSECFQLFWDVLMNKANEGCKTLPGCCKLLKCCKKDVIFSLSDEFIQNLISLYVFQLDSVFRRDVEQICISYILLSSSMETLEKRIALFTESLKRFTLVMWDNQHPKDRALCPGHKVIHEFIRNFATHCLHLEKQDISCAHVFNKFFHHLSSLRDSIGCRNFMMLEIFFIFFNAQDSSEENVWETFGKDVGIYLDKMVSQHGVLITSAITNCLGTVIQCVHFTRHRTVNYFPNYLKLVSGMISQGCTPYRLIVAIELLPVQKKCVQNDKVMNDILLLIHNYDDDEKYLVCTYLTEQVNKFY